MLFLSSRLWMPRLIQRTNQPRQPACEGERSEGQSLTAPGTCLRRPGAAAVQGFNQIKQFPRCDFGLGFEPGRGRNPLPQSALGQFFRLVDSKGDSRFVRTISVLFSAPPWRLSPSASPRSRSDRGRGWAPWPGPTIRLNVLTWQHKQLIIPKRPSRGQGGKKGRSRPGASGRGSWASAPCQIAPTPLVASHFPPAGAPRGQKAEGERRLGVYTDEYPRLCGDDARRGGSWRQRFLPSRQP